MPLWLRKFTFQQISDIKKQEAEAMKGKMKGKGTNIDLANPDKSKIPKQAFNPPTNKSLKSTPNYVSKASKK